MRYFFDLSCEVGVGYFQSGLLLLRGGAAEIRWRTTTAASGFFWEWRRCSARWRRFTAVAVDLLSLAAALSESGGEQRRRGCAGVATTAAPRGDDWEWSATGEGSAGLPGCDGCLP
ncbi:hypothetical protein Droror1_Dr00002701 [Drosera rotundifolia]